MYNSILRIIKDAQGEIYAYYERSKDKKLIGGFVNIPYTPDSLLEDFLDGFSGHPNYNESSRSYVACAGKKIEQLLHDDFYAFEKSFINVVCIYVDDNRVCCSLNKDVVSYKDIQFFNEMLLSAREKDDNFEFCFNIVNEDDVDL